MARRSDSRQKMIDAAQSLIRERGLAATAISDVIERSGAPKGSVYFHFPGGKAELALEAAAAHARDQVRLLDDLAADSASPTDLIQRYVDAGRAGMSASDYSRGCGIAPLVIEGRDETDELARASRQGFAEMTDRASHHFVALGVDRARARALAEAMVAGVEGAMITSRALRSPGPWDAVAAALLAYAASIR